MRVMTARRAAAAVLAVSIVATAQAAAQGQGQTDFPNRRIHVIVPYPAGGIVDIVTRIVTDKLSALWGQPIIVEAKPGANSNLGTDFAARAEPDGYTWTFMGPAVMANPRIYPNLRWSEKSFTGVGVVAWAPAAMTVNPGSSAKTVKEFVELAKNHARRSQLRKRRRRLFGALEHGDLHERHADQDYERALQGATAGDPRHPCRSRPSDVRLHRPGSAACAGQEAQGAGRDRHPTLAAAAGRADHDGSRLSGDQRSAMVRSGRAQRRAPAGRRQDRRRRQRSAQGRRTSGRCSRSRPCSRSNP